MHCLRIGRKPGFVRKPLRAVLNHVVGILYLQQLEYEMELIDLPDD